MNNSGLLDIAVKVFHAWDGKGLSAKKDLDLNLNQRSVELTILKL